MTTYTLRGSPAENDMNGDGPAWAAEKDGRLVAIRYVEQHTSDTTSNTQPHETPQTPVEHSLSAHHLRSVTELRGLGRVITGVVFLGRFWQRPITIPADNNNRTCHQEEPCQ